MGVWCWWAGGRCGRAVDGGRGMKAAARRAFEVGTRGGRARRAMQCREARASSPPPPPFLPSPASGVPHGPPRVDCRLAEDELLLAEPELVEEQERAALLAAAATVDAHVAAALAPLRLRHSQVAQRRGQMAMERALPPGGDRPPLVGRRGIVEREGALPVRGCHDGRRGERRAAQRLALAPLPPVTLHELRAERARAVVVFLLGRLGRGHRRRRDGRRERVAPAARRHRRAILVAPRLR